MIGPRSKILYILFQIFAALHISKCRIRQVPVSNELPVDGVALGVIRINVLQPGSLALTIYRPVEHTATLRDRGGGEI
jgi:hypothetical protein